MTKMDKIWIAVATLTYPDAEAPRLLTQDEIKARVWRLFETTITPVMVTRHLVGSEDRQADRANPQRGGSRNRYLTRVNDSYRLYRKADQTTDGQDKTGPFCPSMDNVRPHYEHLVRWYCTEYFDA